MVAQRPTTPLGISRGCFYPLRDRAYIIALEDNKTANLTLRQKV